MWNRPLSLGKGAHITFLFFAFCADIIFTSMLLRDGDVTVEVLIRMNYKLPRFLIPCGVILYTSTGKPKSMFRASYLHDVFLHDFSICPLLHLITLS